MTDKNLQKDIELILQEIRAVNDRLNTIEEGVKAITPEEKKPSNDIYNTYFKRK